MDVLEDDPDGYRDAALAYYAALRAGTQPAAEVFSLPTGEQVRLLFLAAGELGEI